MSRFGLLFCGLCLLLAGCGSQTPAVSGTVKLKSQPLPSGTVLFHGADGRVEHALITADGKYTIPNAPLGSVRITVRSHAPEPLGMPSRGDKAPAAPAGVSPPPDVKRDGKYTPIPPRYLDPEKSGLTYTVQPGAQTHNLELQP